ncbi:MAG: hypothetical protein F6K55_34000 [Moorea sp. SIO4A3]|nr:hypothetical protein [Moorena sp. SIO4A3]
MILIVRWNGHLARSAILVEWASCPFGDLGRMGIRRGTGILPVSFPGGQDAHSTAIQREDSATPLCLRQ